ncbi:hypothetical protein GCM10022252_48360 [Streptosporangium oxazolinicum]|uniref:MFS transporter n=2 Tax=Streptosporangium oxazolinicum TaxID=909287 RepID=A0ABP8B508_9ACTN
MRHYYIPVWLKPALAFAVNGALYGSLLTRYPEIADRVGASEVTFGVVLFAAALGGMIGSVAAPLLVRKFGEVGATATAGCGYALLTISVASAPELVLLGTALFLMGFVDGLHDVSMNAFSVRIQQSTDTPIMGRVHATWSLSMAAAGVLGVTAAALGVPIVVHVAVVASAAFALQLTVLTRRYRDRSETAGPGSASANGPGAATHGSDRKRLRHVLLVLGVAALAVSYVEGPGQEWTGLLLSRGFQAETGVAASGTLAFTVGVVASRLVLDTLSRRVGVVVVSSVSSATITLAMLAGLLTAVAGGPVWWALAAIALAGLGAGPVFPLLYGAADQMSVRHGIAPATTASIVSTLARIGTISAPIIVGPLTETFGLSMVFVVIAAGGGLLLFSLPGALRVNDARSDDRPDDRPDDRGVAGGSPVRQT